MLTVTKSDIKGLNDSDLRTLIGMLCEAELYLIGNRTGDVMYGGSQDEPDDGIDVYVNATKVTDNSGFILKNNTVFQVKKSLMPPNKITKEMKSSDNNIRQRIAYLNETNGAYIIVSSADDLTQKTYGIRITSMKKALDEAKLPNIQVEFYDCGRIASWVRNYPAIVCWVMHCLKKNINGWTSYCNWSSRNVEEKEFLFNEDSVIYKNNISKENKLSLLEGINEIRKILLIGGNSVRLAGLSGVGKTRLAQALFDDKIGDNVLNKEMVIYGDVGDCLDPNPILFIQQLQMLDKNIILIIDNCESIMHNKLTEICQREQQN